MSKTLINLRDKLSENIGDYLHSTVTTALAASTNLVDTTLNKYTNSDNYFDRWYALITSENNDGENRRVDSYTDSTNTAVVYGGNFTSDVAALATYELHRFNPDNKTRAINKASRDLYPWLFRSLTDYTLCSNNSLPNGHFEDWASASYPDKYSVTNATASASTTAGTYRGGTTSAKVTASAANGYMSVSSNAYGQLLNLQDKTVTFKAWAYPETADDATLVIYTVQADGTEQTLTSTTSCPAGKWTLLELEDQQLNDNLSEIQFRFKVATNAKYVYFDNARGTGVSVYDYLLPTDFAEGKLLNVSIQMDSNMEDGCDDIRYGRYFPVFDWGIRTDGANKWLVLDRAYGDSLSFQLQGYAQLDDNLSADTDTVTIDDPYTNMLVAQSIVCLYEIESGGASIDSKGAYYNEMLFWMGQVNGYKKRLSMTMPTMQATRSAR